MTKNNNLNRIKELLDAAQINIDNAKKMLGFGEGTVKSAKNNIDFDQKTSSLNGPIEDPSGDKIVEGVFNGQLMVDTEGNEYPVPANYASKSKLIPGDTLKLTIKPDGTFLYKQIGPIPRKNVIGTLTYEDGQYKVIAEGKAYKVLLASVTYFKGEISDKVTLIIPANDESEWGAIENIIPQQ